MGTGRAKSPGTQQGVGASLTRPGFTTEAEEVQPDTFISRTGGGERGAQGGESAGQAPVAGKFLDPVGTGKTGFTLKGQIGVPRPEAEQAIKQQAEQDIFEAEHRAAVAEGEAMGFSEVLLSDYANIAQADALEGRRLHQEHFNVARDRMDGLYKQVDQARALQVNPYNWHESVGRGGRVAAAFSLLTGQMAAGAGNPNSALKMMDAAIERDIAAQEQNIKGKFDALKIQRGLTQDEARLFQDELASLNETRAVAYAAIQGRIAAAKQHAINEAHYAATEVMEDHYNIKLLDAIQAARQNIHVEVDKAVNASKLKMQLRNIEQMQSQLKVGTPLGPSGAATTSATQTSAETALPSAPGRAGSVGARRGRPAPTATPPTPGTPSAELPEGFVDRGAPRSGVAEPREIEAEGQSRSETQDEADLRYARDFDAAQQATAAQAAETGKQRVARVAASPARGLKGLGLKAFAGGEITEAEMARVITKPRAQGGADVPRRVAKAGGYGLAFITDPTAGTGEPSHKTTSLAEGLSDIAAGKKIRNGGFIMNADADLVAAMVPEPNPALYEGGRDGAGYKIAKQAYDFGQEFEEIYETRATVDGQRNTIIVGGASYKLAEGALARTDETVFREMQEKLAEVNTGQKAMMALAKQIRTHGVSGIFTPEGGFNIPGINTADETTMLLANRTITNAMQYIKTHDPTARISDKDLEVGERAMGGFLTKGGKILDFLQSLDGDSYNNTKRRQIENFLVHIAIEAQRMVWEKFENELVPDYNTMIQTAEDADELQKFIDRNRSN